MEKNNFNSALEENEILRIIVRRNPECDDDVEFIIDTAKGDIIAEEIEKNFLLAMRNAFEISEETDDEN